MRSLGARLDEIFPDSERGDEKFVFLRYADFRDTTIKEQRKSERWIVRRILTTKEVRVLKSFTPRETYHWNSAADFERRLTAAANIKGVYSRLCVH